jgi:hypothetical protein
MHNLALSLMVRLHMGGSGMSDMVNQDCTCVQGERLIPQPQRSAYPLLLKAGLN